MSPRPAALQASIRARISDSSHGILGPPVSTLLTPICFKRRIAAVSVAATPPRQIRGMSLPSTGIRVNFGADAVAIRGATAVPTAAAPTACSNRLRDKAGLFMRREDIGAGRGRQANRSLPGWCRQRIRSDDEPASREKRLESRIASVAVPFGIDRQVDQVHVVRRECLI